MKIFGGNAEELRLQVGLENRDASFHDNFEKKKRLLRFPIDKGCRLDSSCLLEVGDEERTIRLPEADQALHHLALFKDPGLANQKSSADLRTADGFRKK